jgi:asparagine synthase (glutamine-hydrolysing)
LRAALGAEQSRPKTVEQLAERVFERWGDQAPQRLAGSGSFILRDERRDRFLAVADRVGLTRLYYVERSDGAIVSPAIESLLPFLDDQNALDLVSTALHICGQAPQSGSTFFTQVRAVPPGHVLTVGRGTLSVASYWRPEEATQVEYQNDDAYIDAVRGLLERVTSEQLTDARPALALSGGVDSPVAALIVGSLRPDEVIHAIRIVAPESGDTTRSAEIAIALGFESHEIDIAEDFSPFNCGCLPMRRATPHLPMMARVQERMIAGAALLGAERLVTGWGGDELFGAHVSCYPELLLAGRWRELLRQTKRHARDRGRSVGSILGKYLVRPLLAPFGAPLLDGLRPRVPPVSWLGEMLRGRLRRGTTFRKFSAVPGRSTRLDRVSSPGSVEAIEPLVTAARNVGIEVTSPFADHRVCELALGLPSSQIFRAGRTKIVLRNLLRRQLPGRLVDDLGKSLLGARFAELLRVAESDAVRDLMTNMRSAELGFVDEEELLRHYDRFVAGEHRNLTFWNTLTLEAWLRRYA